MSIVSRQSITRWLNQVILPYPSRDQALSQLEATLDLYPTLSPKTDSFTFDDGRTALLVSLIGTIAVDYRGSRYNIPIAIWLPFEFPKGPPIVYVTPTNEMIIKTSTHVDPSGKCLGGYLDSWQSKPELHLLISKSIKLLTIPFHALLQVRTLGLLSQRPHRISTRSLLTAITTLL